MPKPGKPETIRNPQTKTPSPTRHRPGGGGGSSVEKGNQYRGISWMFMSTSPLIPGTVPVQEYCHMSKW